MKAVSKVMKIVLFGILVLVVLVAVLIHLFGNSVLKTGIENAASKTLNVDVTIDALDFSMLGGKVSFRNLTVNNPPGYEHDKLLEIGDARIAVSIGSLLKDTVNIKEILIDGIDITFEQKGVTGNNLQDVIKTIPKPDEQPQDKTAKPGKKLHIEKLQITNVTVKAKLLPVPGKADTVTLKLEPILMTDLGSDDKLDTAKLSAKILLAIAQGIAEQGAGLLPEGVTDAMKKTLGKATDLGEAAAKEGKKLLEKSTDTGKEIIEGFRGLLKPKKK